MNTRTVSKLLFILGWVGLISGIGALAFGFFYLMPQAERTSREVRESLALADRALGTLEPVAGAAPSGASIVDLFPETLTSIRGTLNQGSTALVATARTIRSIEGRFGLILPSDDFELNAIALTKTAEQLSILSKLIDEIQTRSIEVRAQGQTPPLLEMLGDIRKQLNEVGETYQSLNLPWAVMGVSAVVGGLFAFLGLLAFALRAMSLELLALRGRDLERPGAREAA